MAVTLDGQILFDEQGLEIAASSAKRDVVERAVAGLDGVVSIDLGRRSRVIKQKGVLRTPSQSKMDERIGAISAFIDGKAHTLIGKGGEKFEQSETQGSFVGGLGYLFPISSFHLDFSAGYFWSQDYPQFNIGVGVLFNR